MKISVALVSLLAAPTVAAAFTTGSYLDGLSSSHQQNHAAPADVPTVPVEYHHQLPMIPQEPVLKALDTLDDNMNRIHDENMEALLEISSSFKKLAIRSKAVEQEDRTCRQLEDDLRIGTVVEEEQEATVEAPTAFVRHYDQN